MYRFHTVSFCQSSIHFCSHFNDIIGNRSQQLFHFIRLDWNTWLDDSVVQLEFRMVGADGRLTNEGICLSHEYMCACVRVFWCLGVSVRMYEHTMEFTVLYQFITGGLIGKFQWKIGTRGLQNSAPSQVLVRIRKRIQLCAFSRFNFAQSSYFRTFSIRGSVVPVTKEATFENFTMNRDR